MEKLPAPLQTTASAGRFLRKLPANSPRLTGPGAAVGLVVPAGEAGVGERGLAAPPRFLRRLEPFERGVEGGRRGVDRELRAIDATELFDAGKHVHEGLTWPRNVDEGVTLRGQFAQPPADEQDEIGT